MREQAVAFGVDRGSIGVLTDPPAELRDSGRPAFVFLNSGLIHRIGPNRLHVDLARKLAARGFPSLRFDLSGIGDSPAAGEGGDLIERFVAETRRALDYLQAARTVERFVLFGNCSGAGVGFLTALEEPRVAGVALINPQGPRVKRYYLRLARNPKTWRRALSGGLRRDAGEPAAARAADPPPGDSTALDIPAAFRSVVESERDLLVVFSEWDAGLDYFAVELGDEVRILKERQAYHVIRGMNHDFDLVAGQVELVETVCRWTERLA